MVISSPPAAASGGALTGYSKVMDDLREYLASQTTSNFSTHITDGVWHCLAAARCEQPALPGWEIAADTYTVPAGKKAVIVRWGTDTNSAYVGNWNYATTKLWNVTLAKDIIGQPVIGDVNSGFGDYGGINYDDSGVTAVPAGSEFGIYTYLNGDALRAASGYVIFKVVDA